MVKTMDKNQLLKEIQELHNLAQTVACCISVVSDSCLENDYVPQYITLKEALNKQYDLSSKIYSIENKLLQRCNDFD